MQFAATPNFYPGPTIPPQCPLAAGPREGRSFPTLVTCKSTWLSDPSKNSKTSFGLLLVASILPPSRFCPLYHSCCLPTPAASRVPAVPYTAFKGTEPPKQWSRDAPIRPILRWPERWASAPPFATSLLLISSWPQKPPPQTPKSGIQIPEPLPSVKGYCSQSVSQAGQKSTFLSALKSLRLPFEPSDFIKS